MCQFPTGPRAVAFIFSLWFCLSPLIAQQAPQTQPAANAETLSKQLTQLLARRTEILNRLSALRRAYPEADSNTQKQIEAEFNQLVDELGDKNEPATLRVAEQLIAVDPTNVQAGEVIVQSSFSENKYERVIAVAEPFIAAGNETPIMLNLCGAAYFATQRFETAKAILEKASAVGGPIFQQVGGIYLQSCDEYIKLWEREQQIRAKEKQADDLPRVSIKTSRGEIVVELFENEAPNTVANFIHLVETKVYDGTVFHRVIPNFMAQGGDPNTLDNDPENDGQGGPGYRIACECYRPDARMHFAGSLSMAHAGKDTGGSQFFLTHLPTSHLNPKQSVANGPSGHTVFGRVLSGMDVVLALEQGDRIESAVVLRKRNHPYEPKKI